MVVNSVPMKESLSLLIILLKIITNSLRRLAGDGYAVHNESHSQYSAYN